MSGTLTHANVHEALSAAQAEFPVLPKPAKNPHFKSKFTPLDVIAEKIDPILAKFGLSFSSQPASNEVTGEPVLRYALSHGATDTHIRGEMNLFPVKRDPQGQGASITYARRYAKTAVLDLVADEDVDGEDNYNRASKPAASKPKPAPAAPKTLTTAQAIKLQSKLNEIQADYDQVNLEMTALGASELTDLTAEQAKALVAKFSGA